MHALLVFVVSNVCVARVSACRLLSECAIVSCVHKYRQRLIHSFFCTLLDKHAALAAAWQQAAWCSKVQAFMVARECDGGITHTHMHMGSRNEWTNWSARSARAHSRGNTDEAARGKHAQ